MEKVNTEKQYGILVDLDRCVGCYACEVACKQENSDAPGTPWIKVNTIGPKVVSGRLIMDYVPLISNGCNSCRSRGFRPSCVAHCPTKALTVLDTASMLDAFTSSRRYQLLRITRMSE